MQQISLIKDKTAILTVGLPLSGKTNYAKTHFSDYTRLEMNTVRRNIFYMYKNMNDDTYNSWDDELEYIANQIYYKKLNSFFMVNTNLILSDNWLNTEDRLTMIVKLQDRGYNVQVVYFDTEYDVIKATNALRKHPIPKDKLESMYLAKLTYMLTCDKESKEFGYHLTKTE